LRSASARPVEGQAAGSLRAVGDELPSATGRDREMANRVALGATPGRIRKLIVGDGFKLIALGLAIGLFAAYLASTLSAALYALRPHGLVTFVGVAVTLLEDPTPDSATTLPP
jgi:hypothetical protein